MLEKLKKVLLYIIIFKFIVGLISTLGYFSHPHIIRQVDTMSVGLNYWLRWSDGVSAPSFLHNLLPGSLGGGDTPGITPMEFPLLNLFIAPWFSVGHYWGFSLSFAAVICLNFFLLYVHYKKWNEVSSEFGVASLLMGVFGVSGIYIYRIMPDFASMVFVSLACAYSFKGRSKYISFLLLSIGLLMKPTSAIVLAILFFRAGFWRNFIFRDLAWICGGLFVGALYYTKGISYLSSVSDLSGYFEVGALSPLEGLYEAFRDLHRLPKLIFKNFFSSWVILPISLMLVIYRSRIFLWIICVLALQVTTIFMIDGSHAYGHDYYFIGCSFMVCWLVVQLIQRLKLSPIFLGFCVLLVIFNVERGIYRLKPIWKSSKREKAVRLLKENPSLRSARAIQTKTANPPEKGLLFGKFQGETKPLSEDIQLELDRF